MIKLSAAALAYARQPGFSALVFSDVKPPTGQSAAYPQAAANDLRPAEGSSGLGLIIDPAANEDRSLRFEDLSRLQWLPPRSVPDWYDGLRLVAQVDGSDIIGHHVYDPAGSASTIRTDGDGPGLATGFYMFGDTCRRLSAKEAARTHSISETTYHDMEQFVTESTT